MELNTTEILGWLCASVLVITISRQVYTQWRDKTSRGVSKWLFIGQFSASFGFIIYSWLVESWVFVVTNFLMCLTALVGQFLYYQNKK